MNLNSHTADINYLYELSMAIGNSLDYQGNCNHFLQLLLARKSLSSCWIYRKDKEHYTLSYSYPNPNKTKYSKSITKILDQLLYGINAVILEITTDIIQIAPIPIQQGSVLIFDLQSQGILFLHSTQKDAFLPKDISQLKPIMNKFILSLEACESFTRNENLLNKLAMQNRELNDYAHIVSHDLKSPLRNIYTLLHWINEDTSQPLDTLTKQYFDRIGKNVEKMDTLISGILEYSTLDKRKKDKRIIDLYQLLNEVILLLTIPSHISIKIPPTLPKIIADPIDIKQIFYNLLMNAIKSIDKPLGTIKIEAVDTTECWQFKIIDNGKGIEEKYFQKIFQVFQKLEDNSMSNGMGLAMTQKIVAHYGGTITVASKKDEGSIFSFNLKK